LAGKMPEKPGTPSRFYLTWNETLAGASNNDIWLDGDTNDGHELILLNAGSTTNPQPQMKFENWSNGNVTKDTYIFANKGDFHTYNNYSYELFTQWDKTTNLNKSNMAFRVKVEVRSQPKTDSGFLSRIPIVGGLFSAGQQLAATVVWVGSVFYWFFARMAETGLNILGAMWNVISFLIDLMGWIIGSYGGMLTASESWAKVFLSIPGLIFSLEFAKLIMVGIKLLPTT